MYLVTLYENNYENKYDPYEVFVGITDVIPTTEELVNFLRQTKEDELYPYDLHEFLANSDEYVYSNLTKSNRKYPNDPYWRVTTKNTIYIIRFNVVKTLVWNKATTNDA